MHAEDMTMLIRRALARLEIASRALYEQAQTWPVIPAPRLRAMPPWLVHDSCAGCMLVVARPGVHYRVMYGPLSAASVEPEPVRVVITWLRTPAQCVRVLLELETLARYFERRTEGHRRAQEHLLAQQRGAVEELETQVGAVSLTEVV